MYSQPGVRRRCAYLGRGCAQQTFCFLHAYTPAWQHCSRFCTCQIVKDVGVSIKIDMYADSRGVGRPLGSTIYRIPRLLFREQGVGGSNPLAPAI